MWLKFFQLAMSRLVLIVFLLLALPITAQEEIDAKWGCYAEPMPTLPQSSEKRLTSGAFLVRFDQPIKRTYLKSYQLTLLRLLDRHHAIVWTNDTSISVSKGLKIIPANNHWKLSDQLLTSTVERQTSYVARSLHPAKTRAFLATFPSIAILKQVKNDLYFRGALPEIKDQLLARSEVRYLGLESMSPIQESIVLDLNPAVNNVNAIYQEYPELDGSGINISVKDNKFRENDLDLLGKLINSPQRPEIEDDHATDMATIIAGLGNTSIKGKGIATAARLQTSDFLNLPPDPESNLSEAGVYIQNHSYGTISENFYGSLAAAYDTHIADHPEELHIFSSGNAGEEIPMDGPYANVGTYSNLTGNFKMAKNTLIIGAMDEEKKVQPFSSKGPTYDGRIKPELIGYSITGTSNATALTSGVSALLLQAYQQTFETNAPAALIKALLINTADDIDKVGPDYRSGYGAVNAFKSVQSLKNTRFISGTVAAEQTETFEVTIPPNVKSFKATLVWTDPPAEINSNRALVNDLDFLASDAEGTPHLPWVLDASPNQTALETAAQKGIDRLNNVEQISIENPPAGVLSLQVQAYDISTESQEFSIAYDWELTDGFRWNYPIANDNFPYDGETASYFRWESSFAQDTGILSISYDLGESWEQIAENISLKDGFYLWPPPEDFTGTARLKMEVEGNAFSSDPFVISRTTATRTSLDCEETIELNWNPQRGVSAYNVYNLEETRMQAIATVTDTTFVIDKSAIAAPYFAVEPILDDGTNGIRGETVDYTAFDAGCYQATVFASPTEDGQAGFLSISLTSIHEVASVVIERKNGEEFAAIGDLNTISSLSPTFLDMDPEQGLNQYRVRIILSDGRSYVSEATDLVFLTSTPFIALPNPITNGVTVYSGDFTGQEVQLEVYGIDGKLILQKTITETQEFVPLEILRPGMYVLQLFASEGAVLRKLVFKR